MLGCGRCEYCRAGNHHVCPNRDEVGIRDDWAGALAEKVLIPTRFAYEIPEHVSVTAAALVEPGGNSLRAVRAAKIEPGHKVLVLGSGTIGLLAAQFALADGAEVHVGGEREGSLELARSLGVHAHLAARRARGLGVRSVRRGHRRHQRRHDARAVGAARRSRPAASSTSGCRRPRASSTRRDIVFKDITAVGILSASPGLAGAIEAFASGAVVPDAIVSEVIALDEVPSRLEGQRGPDAGPGPKVHVDPRLGS